MSTLPSELEARLDLALHRPGLLLALTGAGISAESGIPTFRGAEGFWRVGSRNYRPEELATQSAFRRMPREIWSWYLYRVGICRRALPNAAHLALVEIENAFRERFLLVTQNVDGLHRRAGHSGERLYAIHGDLEQMRCSEACGDDATWPLAEHYATPSNAESAIDDDTWAALRCPRCHALARPHVLWFDEAYDEGHFRYQSALRAAANAAIFVVVGTTGTTSLPLAMTQTALEHGSLFIVIDPEPTTFARLAQRGGGFFLQGAASFWLPLLRDALLRLRAEARA